MLLGGDCAGYNEKGRKVKKGRRKGRINNGKRVDESCMLEGYQNGEIKRWKDPLSLSR